jgi:hypothetical protein
MTVRGLTRRHANTGLAAHKALISVGNQALTAEPGVSINLG